jgi:hypothetical protein
MKQNFYKITASNRFQAVIQFLRKELGWKASDPLFTYINLAFSPAPDDTVSNLFKSFATDNHLIVNYRCVLSVVGSEVPCSNVRVARPPRGAEPVGHHPEHHATRPPCFRYDGTHLPSPAKAPRYHGGRYDAVGTVSRPSAGAKAGTSHESRVSLPHDLATCIYIPDHVYQM